MRTAEILRDAFGKGVPLQATTALSYGTFDELETLLASFPNQALVAIVGHEPTLSELLARLVGAKGAGPFAFKKGGMALVELRKGLEPGAHAREFPAAQGLARDRLIGTLGTMRLWLQL